MGDSAEAVRARTSDLDVGWLDGVLPQARRTHLVSGDRDLRPVDIVELVAAVMPALFDQLPAIVRAFRRAH